MTTWGESEVAEFVGGAMDGRTIETSDPAPHIIRVPVMNGSFDLSPLNIMNLPKPTFRVEDYEKSGRNDAGHIRYILRFSPRAELR